MSTFKITPDKSSVTQLNDIIAIFNKMRGSITGTVEESKKFRLMHRSLIELGKVAEKLNREIEVLTKKNKSLATSQKSAWTQTKKAKAETDKLTASNKRLTESNKKLQASFNKTKKASQKTSSGFSGLVKGAGALMGAFGAIAGVQLFASIIKNVISLAGTFDSLHFALNRIAKDSLDAAASEAFLKEITVDFGAELITTTTRWIKFLAAARQSNVTLKETEDIFRTMTKAAGVLGLKTDELRGIYLALEQMLSKGKVTTEELRRQLGERLPGAMGIMAAALEVTIPQLDKMLKKGEVLSSEALPKFARAVEFAYGIKTVKTVDTLVAAQNRLTTAWQLFVKGLTEGDSWIKKTYGFLLGVATKALTQWGKILQDAESDRADNVAWHTKKAEKALEDKFRVELEMEQKHFGKQKFLQAKHDAAKEATTLEASDKEKADRQKAYTEALKELNDFTLEKEKRMKDYAKANLQQLRDDYVKLKKEEKDLRAKKDAISSTETLSTTVGSVQGDNTDYSLFGIEEITDIATYNEYLKKLGYEVDKVSGKFQHFRKIAEDSGDNGLEPDLPVAESSKVRARALVDYELKLLKEAAKAKSKTAKLQLDDDQNNFAIRYQALQDHYLAEQDIIELDTQIKLDELNNKYEKEAELYANAVSEGKQDKESFAIWEKGIEKEKTDAIELIHVQGDAKRLAKANEFQKALSSISITGFEDEVKEIEKASNIKKAALIAIYNDETNSDADRKQAKKDLAQLEVDLVNDIIDAKIRLLKLDIENLDDDNAYKKVVEDYIAKLEASKSLIPNNIIDPPETAKEKWKRHFAEVLNLAKEFSNALFDIGIAQADRRIEEIEAEKVAVEDKYTKLIDLAGANATHRKNLEQERDGELRKLDKKKLKEEQKKAKLKKAQAMVEIAINTAIGVSAVTKEGVLGLAMIPIIIALGAAQLAAVAAQPIPKYKDGLKNASSDHIGMINDGGNLEYIERNGELLATPNKNALVGIQKGDTIHKDFESLKKNSSFIKGYDDMTEKDILMFTAYNKSQQVQNKQLDTMLVNIEKSIEKGFKKARINNTIVNKMDDGYSDSMSYWN